MFLVCPSIYPLAIDLPYGNVVKWQNGSADQTSTFNGVESAWVDAVLSANQIDLPQLFGLCVLLICPSFVEICSQVAWMDA